MGAHPVQATTCAASDRPADARCSHGDSAVRGGGAPTLPSWWGEERTTSRSLIRILCERSPMAPMTSCAGAGRRSPRAGRARTTISTRLGALLLGASVLCASVSASDPGRSEVTPDPRNEGATCLLVLGVAPTAIPIGNDDLLLVAPFVWWPVVITSPPVVPIPGDDTLLGLTIYAQLLLGDAQGCPEDPIKTSCALEIPLGSEEVRYGLSTGLDLWLADEPAIGGALVFGVAVGE